MGIFISRVGLAAAQQSHARLSRALPEFAGKQSRAGEFK